MHLCKCFYISLGTVAVLNIEPLEHWVHSRYHQPSRMANVLIFVGAYSFVPLSFEVDCTLRINRLIPFVPRSPGWALYSNDIDSEQKAKLNITPMLSILGPGPFISRAFSEYLLQPTILFDPWVIAQLHQKITTLINYSTLLRYPEQFHSISYYRYVLLINWTPSYADGWTMDKLP